MKVYKTTVLDENDKVIWEKQETEKHWYKVKREILEK